MIPTWSMPPRTERASPAERQASPKRGESLESPVHRSIRGTGGCSKFQHGKTQNSTNNCWFWWGNWMILDDFGGKLSKSQLGNKDFGWFWCRKTFQISSSIGWWTESLALAYRSEVPDEMCWAVGAWLSGCPVDYHPFSHWRLAWLALSPFIKTTPRSGSRPVQG